MQRALFNTATEVTSNQAKRSLRAIIELLLNDPRPLIFLFSGGKDSSTAMMLGLRAMRILKRIGKLPDRPHYVISSDTLLEQAPVADLADRQLEGIRNYADHYGLPVEVHKVMPKETDTFWVLYLGAGYILPDNQNNRWCTERLKISPADRKLKEILVRHSGFIAVVGSRADESHSRGKRLSKNTVDGLLKTNDNPNCNNLAVIESWTEQNVWSYLSKHRKSQWWCDVLGMIELYADGTGNSNECKSVFQGQEVGKRAGCKQNRFGCICCPLANDLDRSLQGMVDSKKYPYLKPINRYRDEMMGVERMERKAFDLHIARFGGLEDFKAYYTIIHNGEDEVSFKPISQKSSWLVRDPYIHGRQHHKFYNNGGSRQFMTLPGGWTLEYRIKMFTKLLEAQEESMALGGRRLLLDFEVKQIQARWWLDGDMDYTAFRLANAYGYEMEMTNEQKGLLGFARDLHSVFSKYGQERQQSTRYAVQAAVQIVKQVGPLCHQFFSLLIEEDGGASAAFEKMPCNQSQFFPTPKQVELIQKEWADDQPHIGTLYRQVKEGVTPMPIMTLFGYEGEAALVAELENGIDILNTNHGTMKDFLYIMDREFRLEG